MTGATGLVGGWLIQALRGQGADIVGLVREGSLQAMPARRELLDQITTVPGDITSLDTLKGIIHDYRPHTAFHLAGQPLVQVARRDPLHTLQTNVMGTANLLEACRLYGNTQVVLASSDKAYGSSTHLPYLETHPLEGCFPYDCSKSCTDLIARMYAVTYHLRAGVARCANLFGGGDLNFSRIIPGLIRATLAGDRFCIRSDGRSVRDFLYVKDVVQSYLLLGEKLAGNPALSGEAFNFSLQERLSVLDIVHLVLDVMGRTDLQPVILNESTSEIREQYMDSSKARKVLAWCPSYGMRDAMEEVVAWYRDYFSAEAPEMAALVSGGKAGCP